MALDWDKARDAVRRELAARGLNPADLIREAGVDQGTVLDFLSGARVPQLRSRGKIESALGWPAGSLEDVARGAPSPGTVRAAEQDATYVADRTGPPAVAQISDDELADRIRIGLEAMDEMRRRQEQRGRPVEGAP